MLEMSHTLQLTTAQIHDFRMCPSHTLQVSMYKDGSQPYGVTSQKTLTSIYVPYSVHPCGSSLQKTVPNKRCTY